MDYLLFFIGFVLIIFGILGCVLPIIPGPPLSFLGLLSIQFAKSVDFSTPFLLFWAMIAIGITLLDYIIPIIGTKKFGGTKYGSWGSVIGLIIGLFLGPFGIIAGLFLGAFIGEIIGGTSSDKAIKAAIGSFVGFLLGTGLKLVASGMMAYFFFKEAGIFILKIIDQGLL
jgi:uncharacterized protein